MPSSGFFDTPDRQSIIKTKLVAKYFGAWSNVMLGQARGPNPRIAYVDLFSGPGAFADGKESTPLWVLRSALKNPRLCSRLVTMFNDQNPEYAEQLRVAIDALPNVTELTHKPVVTNYVVGQDLVGSIGHLKLVPTLFFIDPWGYKGLSLELVGTAIKSWGCDCIFFFNYNRINLGLNNPAVKELMDDLFGPTRADQLREKVATLTPQDRQDTIVNELAEALRDVGGGYVLPFEFKSRHGERTSHHIIFVSKKFLGYHIMKDVMYGLSSDPDEVRSFEHAPVRSPQLRLLYDLNKSHSIASLKVILERECAGQTMSVWQVYERHSVNTPYTLRNFKEAIKALESEGKVAIDIPAVKRQRNGEVTLGDKRIVTFPPLEGS